MRAPWDAAGISRFHIFWLVRIMTPSSTFLRRSFVMAYMRTILLAAVFLPLAIPALAEDKSYYSPVIQIDKENHRILISTLGSVFYIDVPEAGQPHMEKLPISGLVDFVVEMRGNGQMPLVKTWKVKSGESTCLYFNGKECK
jgi:hypothetical protein